MKIKSEDDLKQFVEGLNSFEVQLPPNLAELTLKLSEELEGHLWVTRVVEIIQRTTQMQYVPNLKVCTLASEVPTKWVAPSNCAYMLVS